MTFSDSEKGLLVDLARDAIRAHLEEWSLSEPPARIPKNLYYPEGYAGAFVTLRRGRWMRGCIGLLESPYSLPVTIMKMALAAATDDPRFPAVTLSEVQELFIEISVLSPMQRIKSIDEFILGVHGVLIKKGSRSGVFLPQVAKDMRGSRAVFLAELCAGKAGLPVDAWQDPDAELYIFTAEVFPVRT